MVKKSLDEVIEETTPRAVGMVRKRSWPLGKYRQKKDEALQRAWRRYSKFKKENKDSKSLKKKYV